MTKTLSVPQVTTTERDDIVSPANGMLIYNIDLSVLQSYNGVSWVSVDTVDMQGAYDNGSTVQMSNGQSVIFNSSTSNLAMEIVEAGTLSAVKANRGFIAEYDGPGGPFFYANTTSQGAIGDDIGSFYVECLDSTSSQKTFKNWATKITNDTPVSFETQTVIYEKINDNEVTCFSFGVENSSFRDLNMQNNPITNAGTITATQLSTPSIDLQSGTIFNSNYIETQSFVSALTAQLNQIDQTNPFGGGPLNYNIFDAAPPAGSVSYQIVHRANNSSMFSFEFMRDEVLTLDVTAGSETAARAFYCANQGLTDEYMRFAGDINQVVFYKSLDLQSQNVFGVATIQGTTGYVDFSNSINPTALEISSSGANNLSLNSNSGFIQCNQGELIDVGGINGITAVGGLSAGIDNSATLTGSTAEQSILSSAFVGSRQSPPNSFKVGDSFTAVLAGNFSSSNGDTLTLRLKGGTGASTILSFIVIPLNASSNTYYELEIDFTVREIGGVGAADLVVNYDFSYNQSSGGNFQGERKCEVNSTTFDTTILNELDVTAQFSSTSANNSIETLLSTLTKTF